MADLIATKKDYGDFKFGEQYSWLIINFWLL